MRTVFYPGLLLYFLLLLSFSAYTQNLQQQLDSFSTQFLASLKSHEKARAHLFTDRSLFKAGETIWFRSFLLHEVSQKVYTKTKYLFVDLVDDQDRVVVQQLLDAANQQLEGKILLPADLASGNYWLRAYTQQMTGEDSDYCSVKPVYVIGRNDKRAFEANNATTMNRNNSRNPELLFYPEGGAIMTRINTTVALLVRDADKKPLPLQGYVKDNRDSIVARFSSNKFGLGRFELFPYPSRKYTAYLTWKGQEISYPLPSFNLEAGQISVYKQAAGMIHARVLLEDSIYEKDEVTYVVGISKDSLCFASIGRGQYEFEIPEQSFPKGIATLYLFDKGFRYLSERSVYIKQDNVVVHASTDKPVYRKREKVTLNVSVTDAGGKPLPALFSVAVTDTTFIREADCMSAGINDPQFINNTALAHMPCLTDQDLDLLMLVKKNPDKERSKNKTNTSAGATDSLLFIKGKALDEKNNPAANKVLTLFSAKGSDFFAVDTTDNTGRFSFAVTNYFDSTEFTISAQDVTGKPATIKIEREPLLFPKFFTPVSKKQFSAVKGDVVNANQEAFRTASFADTGRSLAPVTVKGTKEANYNVLKRVSTSSAIITSDMLDERRSVADIVLSVGGLHILQGFLVVNGLTAMKAPDATSEPLLLIDGIEAPLSGGATESPVLGTLRSINPKDIDFIEILKGPEGANYGMRGGNGVILVNMLSSRRETSFSRPNNLHRFHVRGISRPSQFPAVYYGKAAAKSAVPFDNRSTLFWEGSVLARDANPIQMSFFTSDVSAAYTVVINGITAQGDVVYKTVTFQSK